MCVARIKLLASLGCPLVWKLTLNISTWFVLFLHSSSFFFFFIFSFKLLLVLKQNKTLQLLLPWAAGTDLALLLFAFLLYLFAAEISMGF